jgi:tetratricopeptide (TPR) repeat protein
MILKRIPLLAGFIITALFAVGCATTKEGPSKEAQISTWLDVANQSLMESDAPGALRALSEAEKLGATPDQTTFMRVRAHQMRKDYDSALSVTREYLENNPKSSDGSLTLGILLSETGRPKDAIVALRKAAEDGLYSRGQQAQTSLAIVHYRLGELKEAEKWLERAVNTNPTQACVAYYYQGHIHLKASRFREAAKVYEKSTQKFCGAFSEGFLALGIVYQHLKDYDRARKTFLEVESRFPNTQLASQALERLRKLP